jgi:hypothetical protein
LYVAYTQVGTWTTTLAQPAGPTLTSVAPASGTGASQNFTFIASSVNGYRYVTTVAAIINSQISAVNSCYIYFLRPTNGIIVPDDAGGFTQFAKLGSASPPLQNSQCSVDPSASQAISTGNTVQLQLAVTFKPAFGGAKNTYLYALDRAFHAADFTPMGTWSAGLQAPFMTPGPGVYANRPLVTLSTLVPGASIRYTTDGSTPTATAGTLYIAPVPVPPGVTLNAVTFLAGWTTSAMTSGLYGAASSAPAFDPPAGTYQSSQTIALSTATPGATIRYTTDGTAPTPSTGSIYTAPIAISATTNVKAISLGLWLQLRTHIGQTAPFTNAIPCLNRESIRATSRQRPAQPR